MFPPVLSGLTEPRTLIRVSAGFVLLTLLGLHMAPPACATTCSYTAADWVAVGPRARVNADLVVRKFPGRIELGASSRTSSCALLDADSVVLGPNSQAGRVRSPKLLLEDGAVASNNEVAVDLGGGNADCDLVAVPCDRKRPQLIEGSTVLAPGSYGRVKVAAGATLRLQPGEYSFCSLRLLEGGTVEVDNPAVEPSSVRLSLAGRLRLDDNAAVRATQPSGFRVEVAGRRVRLRRRATLEAFVVAPVARLAVAARSTLRGGACVRELRAGARVLFECAPRTALRFVDGSADALISVTHTEPSGCDDSKCGLPVCDSESWQIAGGVTAADFDGDGDDDVFLSAGPSAPPQFLLNNADGTFQDVTEQFGLDLALGVYSGPTFVDVEGDGDLDLLLGGAAPALPRFFRNEGDSFVEQPGAAGLIAPGMISASFADTDRDGDLDVFLGQWRSGTRCTSPDDDLFYRQGDPWSFVGSSEFAGFGVGGRNLPYVFTPNFTDLDNDGWLDLVLACDFGNSRVFGNDGSGRFVNQTDSTIDDENGMGAAVGDIDGDGDEDWFVSSIWDPDGTAELNWGVSGNRLYRNLGDGTFEDMTDFSGLRRGYWGWGACMADFDLDGDLDIFHVNGMDFVQTSLDAEFVSQPAILGLNDGSGRFQEAACEIGLDDTGEGRGVACFDFDLDGDIDILVSNRRGPARLWRNELPPSNFLEVRLRGQGANTASVGSKITVTAGGRTQTRFIHIGSNFASQSPPVAHFGLGDAETADEVRVDWFYGGLTTLDDVASGTRLVIDEPDPMP